MKKNEDNLATNIEKVDKKDDSNDNYIDEVMDQFNEHSNLLPKSTSGSKAKSNKQESTMVSIEINEKTTQFDLYKGIFYMFLSCLLKSIYSVLLKYVMTSNPDLTPFQVMAWRTFLMFWISVIIVAFIHPYMKLDEINRKSLNLVMTRSFLAVFSTPFIIVSLKYLTISEVYSIFYIYPAVIILYYISTGKERVGVLDYACLVTCFIGVILIIKPDFIKPYLDSSSSIDYKYNNITVDDPLHRSNSTLIDIGESSIKNIKNQLPETVRMIFFLLVISAAVIKAIEDIIVKSVGKDVHPFMYIVCYVFIGNIFFPGLMMFFDTKLAKISLVDFSILFSISLTCVMYIYYMALGFQNESAGRVSMVNYLQVVFVFITDIILFGKNPTVVDYLGTTLIIFFNTINGIYKAMKRNEKLEKYKFGINKKEKDSNEKKQYL